MNYLQMMTADEFDAERQRLRCLCRQFAYRDADAPPLTGFEIAQREQAEAEWAATNEELRSRVEADLRLHELDLELVLDEILGRGES